MGTLCFCRPCVAPWRRCVLADLSVVWLGGRLPLCTDRRGLWLDADLKPGMPCLHVARVRSPANDLARCIGESTRPSCLGHLDLSPLTATVRAASARASSAWQPAGTNACWAVVRDESRLQCALVLLSKRLEDHSTCFVPQDDFAERRRAAVRVLSDWVLPALRSLCGCSAAFRVHADVLDILSLRGRLDIVPLAAPPAVAIAAVIVLIPLHCLDNDVDYLPTMVAELRRQVERARGASPLPTLEDASALVHKVRAFLLNRFSLVPTARGVDFGVVV